MNAKVKAFADRFRETPLPRDLTAQIHGEFGVDVRANYLGLPLVNPFIVASGQETMGQVQIKGICEAGWGGFVLKTFIGEDAKGHAMMADWRKKPTYQKTVFNDDDKDHRHPIIVWDGRGDIRPWANYQTFAEFCFSEGRAAQSLAVGSLKASFPTKDEQWVEEEWTLTTQRLLDIGYRVIEIDFSPTLGGSTRAADPAQVLEWYERAPQLMRKVTERSRRREEADSGGVGHDPVIIVSKIMNLEFGLDHQLDMCRRAIQGGADGVLIGNRFFRRDLKAAYGGPELRQRNVDLIQRVRAAGITRNIVATGGVYSGRDALEYLRAGACAVELLSLIMGVREAKSKATEPQFADLLKSLGKDAGRLGVYDPVLFKLLLDPEDGYVAALLENG